MMRKVCIVILSLLAAVSAGAQDDRYNITLYGLYGWNKTWRSHGGADFVGILPINPHFEAVASMEFHTPGVLAVTAVARPKFPVSRGEFFLDGAMHYRMMSKYKVSEFVTAASFGYRMDYVSIQLGLASHTIIDGELSYLSESENVTEPFNLLYRLYVNFRPAVSVWNVGVGCANYTDYQYERAFQPIFSLFGRYSVTEKISALMRVDLKPAGMFSMATIFWGAYVRTGINYKF